MTNLWVTFSTDISGSFSELSGNIIYNVNNLYNFNGNIIDTRSNFTIYELSNNPIQGGVPLQPNNWKQLTINTNLSPFQGYWLGQINTKLPEITELTELLVKSFYYGPLTGSGYEYDLPSNDTTNITNILRISLSEKIQSPETLKNKYMDFSNHSGIFIKISDHIVEQPYSSVYIYFFKITNDSITENTAITIDGTLNIPVITSESIFLEHDINTNNLGQRWIITDLFHLTHGNGGHIPGGKEFITDITYTGILEIDANNIPDIYTSYTNFVYSDTTVTITETAQTNVYNIILAWNGQTRTIESVTIS